MLDLITLTHSAGAILEHHEEPTAWLLTPGGWVAMSMLAVFAIMLKAKVPAIVAGMLDKKIASIREQLDAASALRAEAEALKAEYLAKAKSANKDIAAMRAAAAKDADDIVAKAKVDATALIARRTKMAEEKISAAERAAVSEIRAKTAAAAAAAAADLIGRGHGVKADAKLIDTAISQLN
jgi:F-type H+-transporting ATPase subunit b